MSEKAYTQIAQFMTSPFDLKLFGKTEALQKKIDDLEDWVYCVYYLVPSNNFQILCLTIIVIVLLQMSIYLYITDYRGLKVGWSG